MRTIRRLIYGEVLSRRSFRRPRLPGPVLLLRLRRRAAERRQAACTGYRLTQALVYVTLLMPSHLYELLPIAVLIGTIFVMARLAQSSEYTILRTSGLGPWRALRTLLVLGLAFALLTFAVGDYLAPVADRAGAAAQGALRRAASRIGQHRRLAQGTAARSRPTRQRGVARARRRHAGRAHLRGRRQRLPGVA